MECNCLENRLVKYHDNFSLEKKEEWKADPYSELYDFELLSNRLVQFKAARKLEDVPAVSFLLRTCTQSSYESRFVPQYGGYGLPFTLHVLQDRDEAFD